jgi:two-component system, NtrC family, phosphoglycerate transport system sensor histidine kinase PgtB
MIRFMRASGSSSIWNRLLFSILGIIVIVWMVLAVSVAFFLQVQNDYNEIATRQIPDLSTASELADYSVRLSVIATRIVGQKSETSPETAKDLERLVAGLTGNLRTIENNPRAVDSAGLAQKIEQHLNNVLRLQGISNAAEKEINSQLKNLRWLNADVQSEIDPLMNDFAFNIQVATSSLVKSSDPVFRGKQADLIDAERQQRDAVRRLGDAAANAVTLMFQAAFAIDEEQLTQLRALTDDSLAQISPLAENLPKTPQLSTLQQSTDALLPAANSPEGIFKQRETWISVRAETLNQLGALQVGLKELQVGLSEIAASHRENIKRETERSLSNLEYAIRWLVALTILAALIGALALFGYIRRGIVHPLRAMIANLSDVAQTQNLQLKTSKNKNEIKQLSVAIAEFQKSIETRDAALSSLEQEVLERRKAVETLKLTQQELIQAGKMAALGQMSAGIAHELNQPLAAMQQRLHLLENDEEPPSADVLGKQVGRLKGLVERMGRTIGYLRNFARRSEFRDDSLLLSELIEDSIGLVHTRLHDRNIKIETGPRISAFTVLGDKILIEQVVVNILSNAIDAIEVSENPGRITITARKSHPNVHVSISDNGVGLGAISPNDALDPFVTGKEIGKGLGLGLSISYNIMKDLQGDLWLEPNAGEQGTTANLILRNGAD